MKHLILSYNLYSIHPSDERRDRVLSVINKISPDVMGLQEITPEWKNILDEYLNKKYSFVGAPREEGRDCEYAPVIYDSEKYECECWNTYWLSDTPNEKSRFEDSKYYRICTIAELCSKMDGSDLIVASVHMDYVHSAAEKQAKVLLDIMSKYQDTPVVLCGDFNCNNESGAYAVLERSRFKDAQKNAKFSDISPTFTKLGERYETIDFIFTDKFKVESFFVPEIKINGEYPSDHNPIICEVEF